MAVMPLPFDLEDVVGSALADLLRRVGMLALVVIGGTMMGGFWGGMGEMTVWRMEGGSWDPEYVLGPVIAAPLLVLRPIVSAWGFLYVPFLIATCLYFAKAADPGMRAVVAWGAATGFFAVVGRGEPIWFTPSWMSSMMGAPSVADPGKLYAIMIGIGLVLWMGLSGASWFLALFWNGRVRIRSEEHLMGIAAENEVKRKSLKEEIGGAVADRDFALGDQGDGGDGER